MKVENKKPFTGAIAIFSVAFAVTLILGVVADLAREEVFTVDAFSKIDLLFVMIIAFILSSISMIVVVALVTSRISMQKTAEHEDRRERLLENVRLNAINETSEKSERIEK